jgi:hypothetical protein
VDMESRNQSVPSYRQGKGQLFPHKFGFKASIPSASPSSMVCITNMQHSCVDTNTHTHTLTRLLELCGERRWARAAAWLHVQSVAAKHKKGRKQPVDARQHLKA